MSFLSVLLAKDGPPAPLSNIEGALAVGIVIGGVLLAVVVAALRSHELRRRGTRLR